MNYSSDSLVRARVCEAAQEHFCLRFEDGAECDAVPAGALRWSAELPAVGDWVRARRADATLALIENVEPRTTCISRQRPGGGGKQVLAANVDLIAIVMGLDGDYNLRRLERYLVQAAKRRGGDGSVEQDGRLRGMAGAPCRCTGHNEQHSGTVGARVRSANR